VTSAVRPTSDGPAYRGFQGKVGTTFADSEPWWPERPKPPAGAPNVIVVLVDDMGFSDIGCFGSEIETPNLDAIAAQGIRYANFHVTPLCSPTRAALMTGRNSHAVGLGFPTQIDPGFPGYASELPANQPTLAEVFRANAYSTLMVGKWHLAKDSDFSEAGSRHAWPLQRGFDQFYGFLEALTDFHNPHRLYEGNSALHVDEYPEGYYLTDDLTDRAVRMIREVRAADPVKPFFLYFAHGAVHAPMHAKQVDIEKYRGRYAAGWDRVREARLARQVELGVMPEGTELPPRNDEQGEAVPAWDSLNELEQTLFARYMEVYAAMIHNMDQSVGRVRDVLAELGELENTVFLFTSDNGAGRLGGPDLDEFGSGVTSDTGTAHYFHYITRPQDRRPVSQDDVDAMDALGGPTTWPHYPRGWAMACNTPFRLYKFSTLRGGHTAPLIVSWPARFEGAGQVVRRQYTHVSDVLPTLVDLIGLTVPTSREGLPAEPVTGTSFAGTLDDPAAPSQHREQYYECNGARGYYRDGWEAATVRRPLTSFDSEHWQLFDMEADPTQRRDLSEENPELVEDLKKAWESAAWENQVFPLDEGSGLKFFNHPQHEAWTRPLRLTPGLPTLERYRSSRLIDGRSFQVAVDWAYRDGDEGVLVAHGGQAGGYLLYVEDGELRFEENEYGRPRRLPPVRLGESSSRVVLDVSAPGGGTWEVEISVDGEVRASGEGFAQFISFLPFEGIDVGIDRRSPVSWDLRQRRGTFPFSGRLDAVTYVPGAQGPDAPQRRIEQARAVGLDLQ
jgi:arylsulfatase A-like enzyme